MYRIFLGAPSKGDIQHDPTTYRWQTISSASSSRLNSDSEIASLKAKSSRHVQAQVPPQPQLQPTQSVSVVYPLPFATLEAASHRISLIYKDVIFDDGEEEGGSVPEVELARGLEREGLPPLEDIRVPLGDQTTLYTWPPTALDNVENGSRRLDIGAASTELGLAPENDLSGSNSEIRPRSWEESRTGDTSNNTTNEGVPSFLLDLSSRSESGFQGVSKSDLSVSRGSSAHIAGRVQGSAAGAGHKPGAAGRTAEETHLVLPSFLQTQEESYGAYSDASSIARFPEFHFNLNAITPLTAVAQSHAKTKISGKATLLLAILEVEGPENIRIKKGADAGKEVAILKLIVGDEEGKVGKVTAWRDVAEEWGGYGRGPAVRRGDIVLLENVLVTYDPATSIGISASPYLGSKVTICYRAMPYSPLDGRLRPDLRLGESEPCVRKVATVVRWFEEMAGLSPAG